MILQGAIRSLDAPFSIYFVHGIHAILDKYVLTKKKYVLTILDKNYNRNANISPRTEFWL
jgi:hypothetical protein